MIKYSSVYREHIYDSNGYLYDLGSNYTYFNLSTSHIIYVLDETTIQLVSSTINIGVGITLDYDSQDLTGNSKIQIIDTIYNITYSSSSHSILACSVDTYDIDSQYCDLLQSSKQSMLAILTEYND